MKKKIVSTLLALTMVLSMGAVAFAGEFSETISIDDVAKTLKLVSSDLETELSEETNADSVLDTSAYINIHSARWDSWDGDLFIINASTNTSSPEQVYVYCDDGSVKSTTINYYGKREYSIWVGSHVRQVKVAVPTPNGYEVVGVWGRLN